MEVMNMILLLVTRNAVLRKFQRMTLVLKIIVMVYGTPFEVIIKKLHIYNLYILSDQTTILIGMSWHVWHKSQSPLSSRTRTTYG